MWWPFKKCDHCWHETTRLDDRNRHCCFCGRNEYWANVYGPKNGHGKYASDNIIGHKWKKWSTMGL